MSSSSSEELGMSSSQYNSITLGALSLNRTVLPIGLGSTGSCPRGRLFPGSSDGPGLSAPRLFPDPARLEIQTALDLSPSARRLFWSVRRSTLRACIYNLGVLVNAYLPSVSPLINSTSLPVYSQVSSLHGILVHPVQVGHRVRFSLVENCGVQSAHQEALGWL